MKKNLAIVATLMLTLTLTGCATQAQAQSEAEATAAAASIETKIESVELYGKIHPTSATHITFNQTLKVNQVFVQVGDRLEKDQILAEIDLTSIKADLALLDQQIDQYQRQIGQENNAYKQMLTTQEGAKAKLLQAKEDLDRQKALLDSGVGTQLAYDEAKNQYDQANRDLKSAQISAQGALQSAKQSDATTTLELAKAQVQKDAIRTFLSSPNLVDNKIINTLDRAIVANVNMQNGLFMAAQTSLIELYDVNNLVVKANVSEDNLKHMALGMDANVKFLSHTDISIAGTVTHIGAKAETVNGETMLPIIIELKTDKTTELMVIPNLNVDVSLPLK